MPMEDLDPETQKMCQVFGKVTMHEFWKKVKAGLKNAGEKDEQAAFKALYKKFNSDLGKWLDKFDEAFPDQKTMAKFVPKLEGIFKEYTDLTDESEINQKAAMALCGAIDKLEAEMKRRMTWVKKNVKA